LKKDFPKDDEFKWDGPPVAVTRRTLQNVKHLLADKN